MPDHPTFYAHSANDHGNWHPLKTHLQSVGSLAKEYSTGTVWAQESELAGLLHDLGKYATRFQMRLQGKESGLDHWSQGASLALTEYRAVAAALAIQGHHIGLQRGSKDALRGLLPPNLSATTLPGLQLSDPDIAQLLSRAQQDGLTFQQPASYVISSWAQAVAAMLDVRLLFSCLVDADFLDTEAHFNGNAKGKQARESGPTLDPDAALTALDVYMGKQVCQTRQADANVLAAREVLWDAVGKAAPSATGAFTLTAPTGSGKTLAMLRFALEHAKRHRLKRHCARRSFPDRDRANRVYLPESICRFPWQLCFGAPQPRRARRGIGTARRRRCARTSATPADGKLGRAYRAYHQCAIAGIAVFQPPVRLPQTAPSDGIGHPFRRSAKSAAALGRTDTGGTLASVSCLLFQCGFRHRNPTCVRRPARGCGKTGS